MTAPAAPERRDPRARLWVSLGVVAVLAVAAIFRLWALGHPGRLVFDELYYVRDAVSQLAHGYPTTWPDVGSDFGGERARAFTDSAAAIAHPPLGKWLIGLGMLALGVDGAGIDSAWGWRIAIAFAGILTVSLTMRLGWLISRSIWVACIAGLLLAIDGVHIVMSRLGLLDGFLTLFVVLGALFIWHDCASTYGVRTYGVRAYGNPMALAAPIAPSASTLQAEIAPHAERNGRTHQYELQSPLQGSRLGRVLWRRPWLLAAGLTFGAAAAVKWSGLYPLAGFLVLITVRDLILRYRTVKHPWLGSIRQAFVTAAITLPVALLAYLASWLGWMINPGGQDREPGEAWWVSLWQWHTHAFEWHSTLSAEHPYQANPLGWPIALRPTGMYWQSVDEGADCHWSSGCVSVISSMPNPLVTWGGVVALTLLIWVVLRTIIRAVRVPVAAGAATRSAIAGLSASAGSSAGAELSPGAARPAGATQAGREAQSGGVRALSALAEPSAWAATFVLVGYLSGWLPWLLTFSRSAVFHFYTVVLTPFAALALALMLGALCLPRNNAVVRAAGMSLDNSAPALQGRRVAVAIFLLIAVVLAVLFLPMWSGMPVAEWFWRAHLWLPGWW